MTERRNPNASQTTQKRRYTPTGDREKLFSRIDIDAVFSTFAQAVKDRKEHVQGGLFK